MTKKYHDKKFHDKKVKTKNLEIGVSTKFLVTARIRGNVLLKMSFLHNQKNNLKKKLLEKEIWEKNLKKKNFEKN